mmetsp:Transcript_99174/g.175838  ORF Transcript_99174/g.175838 Transcript_99174/m.175838 type:complete len:294 (-) Transcript_99174:589-1470(-)
MELPSKIAVVMAVQIRQQVILKPPSLLGEFVQERRVRGLSLTLETPRQFVWLALIHRAPRPPPFIHHLHAHVGRGSEVLVAMRARQKLRHSEEHHQHEDDDSAGGHVRQLLPDPGLLLRLCLTLVPFSIIFLILSLSGSSALIRRQIMFIFLPIIVILILHARCAYRSANFSTCPASPFLLLLLHGHLVRLVQLHQTDQSDDSDCAPSSSARTASTRSPERGAVIHSATEKRVANPRQVHKECDGGCGVEHEEKAEEVFFLPQRGSNNLDTEDKDAENRQHVKKHIGTLVRRR